jgi:hypothetical protein
MTKSTWHEDDKEHQEHVDRHSVVAEATKTLPFGARTRDRRIPRCDLLNYYRTRAGDCGRQRVGRTASAVSLSVIQLKEVAP